MRTFFIFWFWSFSCFGAPVDESHILDAARHHKFPDPELIVAIAHVESRLEAKALNTDGVPTYGLMQLQLQTARNQGFKGKAEELFNWQKNVEFSVKYLRHLLDAYSFDYAAVISAYNAGRPLKRGRVYVNQVYIDRVFEKYKALKE